MISSILYFVLFSGLFYFTYKALFAGHSFYQLNRFVLLLIPVVSAAIAFIAPAFQLPVSLAQNPAVMLPEIRVGGQAVNQVIGAKDSTGHWIIIVYALGASLLLAYTLAGLRKLIPLLKRARKNLLREPNIYLSTEVASAFNFAQYIVLPEKLKENPKLPAIIRHEEEHRQQKHFLDNFYFQLLAIAAWFNPFIHLLGKEIRQVHECQADAAVVDQENIEDYAHTLLSSTLGGDIGFPVRALSASPFFNSSLIKTRITMIYKNKTPKWRGVLYLAVLPLMAGMTLLACSKNEPAQEQVIEQKVLSAAEVQMMPLPAGTGDVSLEQSKMAFQQAVIKHISENFKYPEEARELGMEGKVYVGFVINQQGEISEVNIKRGLRPAGKDETGNERVYSEAEKAASKITDDQVIALVQSMPDFGKPAMKDGQPVAMEFTLPIAFKLPESNEESTN